MVHDVCNCVIHGHSIWPKLCVSSCGKSKGSHLRGTHNVPMCSPLGRRAKGPPSFAESNDNGHTNHIRFMPDSYPNHSPPHSPPPITTGVFGGRVHLPPASNRCCLPTASAQSEPTAGSPANPTIQLQSCESYPRIIPPIQTSRPDYGKKIHTHVVVWSFYYRMSRLQYSNCREVLVENVIVGWF